MRCKLHKARTQVVFGVGNPKAQLVFVGEGPGRDEDIQGEPFVGRAGKLLTQMIEAMGLRRSDVYICNVVKCRPPENRLPENDEIATCSPFLLRQLAVIQPKVICCLGACSAQTLLQTNQGISRFRGEWFDFRGLKLIATYHPAYLSAQPERKRRSLERFAESDGRPRPHAEAQVTSNQDCYSGRRGPLSFAMLDVEAGASGRSTRIQGKSLHRGLKSRKWLLV